MTQDTQSPAVAVGLTDRRAAEAPDAPCLSDDAAVLDNAAVAERVRRAATALREAGVGPGDVVGIVLPNCTDLLVALFAAWRLGAGVTTVNPALTAHEMQFQVDDAGARVVVAPEDLALNATILDPAVLAAAEPLDEPPASVDEDALALLIYTSGTTGKPKGVMLDHRNLRVNVEQATDALEITADDHSLLVLPLFHANGIVVGTLTPLLAGGRVTVLSKFSPKTFLGFVEEHRPTYFSAVPAIYAMLSALPEATTADTSSLRVVVCGAAPMPAEEIARVEDRYGVVLVEGYGLSETTCVATVNPIAGPRKPGTVGLPLPGQEIKLVADDGSEVERGGRGEVLIRGENIMRGYLNRPDETAKTIDADGWLSTGDVGVFDEDGYLSIVDRIKDMIIRGGENIYPKEIESVLYGHDDVLEAAVVGRPDDVLGEVVVAYASLRPGATATVADLEALCEEELAKYKRPVAIHLLDDLPKNAVGKLDKPTLRATPEPAA